MPSPGNWPRQRQPPRRTGLPSAYDLAVAGNVCHLFDALGNRRLLARLYDVLRPGGTPAIADALPNA